MQALDIDFVPSPNHSSRGGLDVVGTVIHYTADGPEWNPVRWLTDHAARASAHYMIERDGDTSRLVKLTRKAWHAGWSEWSYNGVARRDVSAFTIGIELANAGPLIRDSGGFYWQPGRGDPRPYTGPTPVEAELEFPDGTTVAGYWEPFPMSQINALHLLLARLADLGYGGAARNLVGHDEISGPHVRSTRYKTDPGPIFPWAEFARTTERTVNSRIIG